MNPQVAGKSSTHPPKIAMDSKAKVLQRAPDIPRRRARTIQMARKANDDKGAIEVLLAMISATSDVKCTVVWIRWVKVQGIIIQG